MSSAPGLKFPAQSQEITQKVDRCAYLTMRDKEAKKERDELSLLKTDLQQYCIDTKRPAALPLRLEGTPAGGPGGATWFLDFTMREMKRTIFNKTKAFNALKKVLGLTKLIDQLTITFKLLDAHVDEEKQKAYVSEDRTGSRDISAGLIQPPKTA